MIFLLIIIIVKSILTCCPCFYFITDITLKDSVYVLFREVVIVLSCILILEALHFYEVLQFTLIDVTGTAYCILLALFIWTVLGFIFIISAQKQIMNWRFNERMATNYPILEKIKSQYETVYYRNQPNGRAFNVSQSLIDKIRYFVMRLEFIHPIYLPPLNESFLRKDFNFAQYLAHAYGKTLTSFFNNSWVSLLLLTICIEIFRVINIS